MHITSYGFASSSSLEFEDADEEPRLFYDSFSNRYFQATFSQVLQAEYHLNRNFALMGGFVPLNMFYEFLGIEPKQDFAGLGWWVDDGLSKSASSFSSADTSGKFSFMSKYKLRSRLWFRTYPRK